MAVKKSNIYIIQKFVKATSIAEALLKERKGTIVDVCLSIADPGKTQMTTAIGFQLRPDGNENINYD